MANVVIVNRPDVVALIEEAARKLTRGNQTEAVALAMRRPARRGRPRRLTLRRPSRLGNGS